MSSKLIGAESEFFAKLVVDAVKAIGMTNWRGKKRYPIRSINIVKCHGQSSLDSQLIKGYVLRLSRACQQMPTRIENARIACLDFNLNKFRCTLGVQVLVSKASDLGDIRAKEISILKERVAMIIKAGANVILTSMGIDDLAQKYLVQAGILAVRRLDKGDLRRIAKSTGAKLLTTLANPDGTESFDSECLGSAKEVYEDTVGDMDYIFVKGFKNEGVVSILIRGANEFMIDEVHRSIHDSICVTKRTLESGYVVPGGGCVEVALNVYLEAYTRTLVHSSYHSY